VAGGVSPLQIYQALTKAGASTVQAIGIMANMINESDLDPEEVNPAGPQAGVGLVQWQTTDYPAASTLVTGNPQADLNAQVAYLAQTGGFAAASGATPSQAAGSFAAGYEKCQGCQPGGAQYNSRVANATTVSQWVTSGKWPASAGSAAAGAGSSSGGTGPGCLLANPFSASLPLIGNVSAGPSCLFATSQARALIGGLMLIPAGVIGLTGVVVLIALGFRRAAPGAGRAAEAVGAGLAVVPGLEGAGLAVAGAGAVASRQPRESIRRRRQGRDERRELQQRGASDLRTANRPQPRPGRPGRRTGSIPGPRDTSSQADQPPF
jgi:hypothetical protein